MSDLESRQLRYFVAVAEELHFGRAAERLGMAQPPLSRAIRDLERQLGVQLLRRTTRAVALTPAGAVLLRDARTALDAIAAAARRAQNAAQPVLRVALKADYDAGLLPRFLAAYREDPAALPVEVLLGGRGEQVPALRDGRADVAILPAPFDGRGLDAEPLLTEPRLLAIAADDPLAARTSVRLRDLAGRVLPDGAAADRPETATPHDPRRTSYDLAQLFNLVELGTIVWFLPESVARRHPRPGVAYRTVEDLGPSTLMIAWPRDSRDHAVAAFVRAATVVAVRETALAG
ncbi:LysR family transcriptional regulator [Dactylosporangium sucinum]|uniref:LysR family transcriptional regulator n=1 Tax=Dactylosporangium sucinum TaxID=1424081 RepID=A0A917X6N2_9ACTN|nr:LysR substrate-binding domain-containing protein [Dactylosporangium sucinum]GGM79083.1 LysR family transcriptional regulator [Dactylosporangium sucinum]